MTSDLQQGLPLGYMRSWGIFDKFVGSHRPLTHEISGHAVPDSACLAIHSVGCYLVLYQNNVIRVTCLHIIELILGKHFLSIVKVIERFAISRRRGCNLYDSPNDPDVHTIHKSPKC